LHTIHEKLKSLQTFIKTDQLVQAHLFPNLFSRAFKEACLHELLISLLWYQNCAVSKTPAISATYNTLMTPMNALCASSCYPCLLSE